MLSLLFLLSRHLEPMPRAPKPRAPAPRPPSTGRKLALSELRELAARAGFPDPNTAAAIAMVESSGDPLAKNISPREQSYGLWQINVLAHPQYDPNALFDPTFNAQAALAISSGGSNWHPWQTSSEPGPHGEPAPYLQYMPGAAHGGPA